MTFHAAEGTIDFCSLLGGAAARLRIEAEIDLIDHLLLAAELQLRGQHQSPERTRQAGKNAEEEQRTTVHERASCFLNPSLRTKSRDGFRHGSEYSRNNNIKFQSKATWAANKINWPKVANPTNGMVDLTTLMNGKAGSGLLRAKPWTTPPTVRAAKIRTMPAAEHMKWRCTAFAEGQSLCMIRGPM